MLPSLLYSFILYFGLVSCGTPTPQSIPLAVRSPYFSAWLQAPANFVLNNVWPSFWTGSTLGWAGFINVDGTSYVWMGEPNVPNTRFNKTVQQSVTITATQSTFVMTAGPVALTIIFLSPVEPTDLVNQSFPFAYMAMSAKATDGNSHKVRLYSDISGEWLSGNDDMIMNWTTSTTGDTIIHQSQLENQTALVDINDRIQQGSSYFASLNASGVTWQTGQDIVVRAQFINNSVLLNTEDNKFRDINDDWPVLAISHDLGTVSNTPQTAVIAIGLVRDPVIEYVTAGGGTQNRSLYFWTRFSSIEDAITTFLGDYDNALARATKFDAQVVTDAGNANLPPNYLSLVEWSIRQAFGGIEITVSKDSTGAYNSSDATAFLKEISSSGRTSTADVIFAAWPLFLYTNPAIGKALLLPLLEYQATGQYPNKWACHDLGPAYPQALGYPKGNDLFAPVEESADMLIMTLSYAQKSKDTSLIKTYYNLLQQWAQYLQENTLTPSSQYSADVFAGMLPNQTNLAMKGIIALQAMSEMATMISDSSLSSTYATTAKTYVGQWQTLATAADDLHLTYTYGNSSSWGLLYNLYADKLLQTNIIPGSIYDTQSSFYSESQNNNQFGIPLNTWNTSALTGWEIWMAAIVNDSSLQASLINDVYQYLTDGRSTAPFPDLYDTVSGDTAPLFYRNRPVVGGNLALLVLSQSSSSNPNTNSSSGTSSSPPSPTSTGGHSSSVETLASARTVSVVFALVIAVTVSALF